MILYKKITYTIVSVFTIFILWGCLFQIEHFGIDVQAEERLSANLDINETNFPDAEFRRFLKEKYANGKEYLTSQEVDNVTLMMMDNTYDVQNIEGIAFFTNLVELNCMGQNINEIDVRSNINLKKLACGYSNALSSLKVNEQIEILICGVASLTELDVSQSTNLVQLFCDHNKLKSLDVSQNLNLELLSCGAQPLETLNISNNTMLRELGIENTNISTIDLSNNLDLVNLNFASTKISEIHVNHLSNLESLLCDNTNLEELDLSNNENLKILNFDNTPVKSVSIPKQNKIEYISLMGTTIENIETAYLTSLEKFNCMSSQLKSLDLSNSPLLTELYCGNTALRSLDLRNNTRLEALYCNNTNLSKLDLRNNLELSIIDVQSSKLMSLDISNITNLKGFAGESQHPDSILLQGNNSIDLKNYDDDIDASKIQDLTGAILEGTILKNITLGTNVTYTYDLGEEMESPLDVTLHFYGENSWITPVSITNWTYKENAIKPNASATYGNVEFIYSNKIDGEYTTVLPVNANTWYVKAYVKESIDYKGLESNPIQFQILPRNALNEDIVVSDIMNQNDIATFVVKDKNDVLVRGVDYDVTSSTKGKVTNVDITFKGNYTGVITKTFESQIVETGISSNKGLWTNVILLSGFTLYVSIMKKKKNNS